MRPSERDPNWRKRPRFWTPDRVYILVSGIEQGLSDAQIGRRVGRSAESINLYRKRHGIASRTEMHLTARDVADLMGFGCSKKVTWLIETGALVGKRCRHGQGQNGCWQVTRLALLDFCENPNSWHLWRWEDITDPLYRRRMKQLRGHVRYLTAAEVAEIHFVERDTVKQWHRKGWLPGYRIGRGNHVYLEADVLAFDRPGMGGDRRKVAA